MTTPSLSEYARVLDTLYGTLDTPQAWGEFVASASTLFGASAAQMISFTPRGEGGIYVAHNVDPEAVEFYERHFAPLDVVRHRAPVPKPGENLVILDEEVCPEREFKRTEFFNDFRARYGHHRQIAASVLGSGTESRPYGFVLFRDDHAAPFSSTVTEGMSGIGVHLRRLEHLRQARETEQLFAEVSYPGAAVFLLRAGGELLGYNRNADGLLQRREFYVVHGRLRLATPQAQSWFEGCLRLPSSHGAKTKLGPDSAPAEATYIQYPGSRWGAPLYALVVRPLPTAASVTSILRQRFGLTTAESAIALALAEGASQQQIAARRQRSLATIQTQVKTVLQKTNCRRQSELVKLVLACSGAVGD